MSRKREYPWEDLQTRYVVGREWTDMGQMAKALAAEAKAKGGSAKAPSHHLINKRAAAENWEAKRLQLVEEARALAARQRVVADAEYLVRLAEEGRDLGRGLKSIGARFIKSKEDQRAAALALDPNANVDGAATTVYEALAMVKTGHVIESISAKMVEDAKNSLAERQGKVVDASSAAPGSSADPIDPEYKSPEAVYSRLARLLGLGEET